MPPPLIVGLHAPGQVIGINVARRLLQGGLHRLHLANRAAVHQLLNFDKFGQRAPIVGHPQRNPRRFARRNHLLAFSKIERHRLLAVDGLACLRSHERVFLMHVRRRRHINGIDLVVADQRLRVIVPAGDAVALGKVARLIAVAPHDGHERRAVRFLKARPALHLTHVADADDAPADGSSHVVIHLRRCGLQPHGYGTSHQIVRWKGHSCAAKRSAYC